MNNLTPDPPVEWIPSAGTSPEIALLISASRKRWAVKHKQLQEKIDSITWDSDLNGKESERLASMSPADRAFVDRELGRIIVDHGPPVRLANGCTITRLPSGVEVIV